MSATMGSRDGLPEEVIQKALKSLEEMMRLPYVQVHLYQSIIRTTEIGDTYESYAPGRGRCIIVEIPCGPGESYDMDAPRGAWTPRPSDGL
jgi:hypothetical protein